MKINAFRYMAGAMTCLASALLLGACSDWTDTEAVDLVEPSIQEQNAELYAKYLENLRAYKKSDHKLVYVWFDNSAKQPTSRGRHITDVPDSVDVISLMAPDNLVEWELKDIETVRSSKGTQVIYTVDFDAMKTAYNEKLELATETEPVNKDFVGFLLDSLETALAFVDKYNYDGICVAYTGKSRLHMRANELKEYTANERSFINVVADWHSRHKDKTIVFNGNPQNLIDGSLLEDAKSILVPGTAAKSVEQFSQIYALAKADNVQSDRYGMTVNATAFDADDHDTGYLADGTTAIDGLAEWAAPDEQAGIKVTAVGIYNVSSDYYNPLMIYSRTRNLISKINPSVK